LSIIISIILAFITFFICVIIFMGIIPLISVIITGNKPTPDFFAFFIIGIPIIVAISYLVYKIRDIYFWSFDYYPSGTTYDTTKYLKRYDNELAITGDYFLPYLDFEASYGWEYKCKNKDSYTCAYCSRRNEHTEYDSDTQSYKFYYTSSSTCEMTITK
ncbi:MAG: hypothetical protein IJX57_08080, partial [Clostridia bacterium]|nr:hypothetical protein [Clostridia bacterium]